MRLQIKVLMILLLFGNIAVSGSLAKSLATTSNQRSEESAIMTTYYTLTVIVDPVDGGWLRPETGTHIYEAGTVVSVYWWHQPDWLLYYYDINGTIIEYPTRPYNITMNANYVLRAVYFQYFPPTISLNPLEATMFENSSVAFVTTVNGGSPPYLVEWCVNDVKVHTDADPDEGPYRSSFEWTFSPTGPGTYSLFARVRDSWLIALPRDQWPKSETATISVNDLSNITIKAYCLAEGADVSVDISMDGSPTGYKTPHTFINLPGIHAFAVPLVDTSGYPFKQWSTNQTSATITVASDGTYVAYYQAKYGLNIATGVGGTTNPSPGAYLYFAESTVNVTAKPYTGYRFDHWELDGVNFTSSVICVTMDAAHNLKVVYAQIQCTLNISTTEGGSVDPAPGLYTYSYGTAVLVTTSANSGYYLDRWELDGVYVGVANPFIIKMCSNSTLHAIFKQLNPGHDVSVKWIDRKPCVGQTYPLSITITVVNVGSYTECLNITLFANSTLIRGQNITLNSGESVRLLFTWNTTGFERANYVLTAFVAPVLEESETADNTFTYSSVLVSIQGDINGDRRVNGKDLAALSKAYNTKLGDQFWDTRADINGDSKIDGRDIAVLARHFGEADL